VVVTTGAKRRAKLQLNRRYRQTNTQLSTDRMPFLLPNSVKPLKKNLDPNTNQSNITAASNVEGD